MLHTLVEYILHLVELFEAEAKALRRGLLRLAEGLIILMLAGLLLAGGFGLLIAGLYLYLATTMPPYAAISLTGVAVLLLAGGLLWSARRLTT